MTDAETRGVAYPEIKFSATTDATTIMLCRHGESEPTPADATFPLVDGRGDPALSAAGIEQSERLATRLSSEPIEAIYITQLRRTAQTAVPIARELSLTPVVEPRLVEVHMGEWEGGLYRERLANKDPLAARLFREGSFDVVPGAEGNAELFDRTCSAIEEIAARHAGARVLVVAHVVSIGAVLARATGARSPFAFVTAENASISEISCARGGWLLRRFNDYAHLS